MNEENAAAEPSPAQPSAMRKALRNAVSVIVGDAGGEVIVGYALALSAVKLGPAGFGTLSAAQAFMEPFEALAAFGLTNLALTTAAERGCDGTLRGTMGGLQIGFGAILGGVATLVAFALGRVTLVPVMIVLWMALLIGPLQAVSMLPFQYERTMHRQLFVPFVGACLRLGALLVVVRAANLPPAHQAAALLGTATTSLLAHLVMRRHYPAKLRFDRALAVKLVRAAWPIAVLGLIVMFYTRASYFFLNRAGPAVQGEYGAADRLLRPLLHVAGVLVVSSLPTVAKLAVERDFGTLRAMYRRGIRRVILLGTPLLAAAALLSRFLIDRFAPEYRGATVPFCILAGGTLFMFLNQLSTTFVMALNRFRVIMWVAAFNLVFFLVLATVLIPRWAATGAAITTAAVEAVNTVIQLIVVSRLLRQADEESRST